MAERLTKKTVKTIQDKYSLGQYLYYDFAGLDDINKLLNKLGKLEDIMERLGINFVEDLEDEIKSLRVDKYVYKKDRDTWQKACELACDAMTKLGGDDCCGCRLNKEMCKICENKKGLIDYFYQQAKKEGEKNNV